MPSIEEIQSARKVLSSVRHVRFDDSKWIDVTDRLGLLTVAAGGRDVAAFGFANKNNEAQLRRLKEILDRQNLLSLITRQFSVLSFKHSEDVTKDLADVFDRVAMSTDLRDTGRLLWVFREPHLEYGIENVVAREGSAGILLGYPPCCVERESKRRLRHQHAFAAAIIAAVGREASAVERALRENLVVEIPADSVDDPNLLRTRERFPFVFHTACDACLSSERSRSAELNRSCEELAETVDRTFHGLFIELAKLEVATCRIIDEAEKSGLRPGELNAQVNERLQELSAESDRIYASLFES